MIHKCNDAYVDLSDDGNVEMSINDSFKPKEALRLSEKIRDKALSQLDDGVFMSVEHFGDKMRIARISSKKIRLRINVGGELTFSEDDIPRMIKFLQKISREKKWIIVTTYEMVTF